ncbi:MAG: tetratricopeptide repeat protein, partial [Planctomycetes bacterium]|nr:tetratricopeptide repeat protein [Planctomycetota bacterium]
SAGCTAFCRAVAKLGIQAAEALHHAHEYGVVHRDIKPSNLMLDHHGKLWITDFGLARVQNSPSVTVTGDVVGTLRYMSPEQAAGAHALVDMRTDIYGLGATLYELLTLQPAFPGDDRHQVLRAIAEREPAPPRSLNADISVDLETIVLQAMAKSRDSRYGTALALAEDLNRFLEGKPTLARRPTLVDRTAKWFRRHRLAAVAAALVLVLLTTVSTVGAILLAREKAEKEAALVLSQQHLDQSQQHFQQARRVVDRFGIQLADQLKDTPGTELLRQQLLMETLNYYHGFLDQIGADAVFRDQLAMTHLKAGVVTAKLGANKKAIDEYRTAQRILEQLIADAPEDPKLQSHLALSRNNLALLLAGQGHVEEALAEYEQAITAQQHLVATHPDDEIYTGHLAKSHVNRGTLLGQLGQTEAAIQSLTHAVTILHKTTAAAPDNPQQARNLAIAYNNLSFVQRQLDANLAEKSAQRAVEILEHFMEGTNASDECRADLALCYSNLAAIQSEEGRTDQAIRSYQGAVSLRESLVRKSPGIVRHRSELAASLNNLALLEIRRGDLPAAAEAFGHANRLFMALLSDYPDQVAYASGWAALLNNQALALAKIERYEGAMEAYRQAVAVQQRVVEQLGHSPAVRLALSRMVYNYSQALQAVGRFDEAAELALTRRQLWQGNGERLFGVAVELAQILQSRGQQNEPVDSLSVESLRSAAVATLQESLEAGHRPQIDLTADPRFENLRDQPGFDDAMNRHEKREKTPQHPEENQVDL